MHKEIFDAAHGRLGLGCMRFPTKADGNIDTETVRQMVDLFMREGFNYFDTAHGYLDGRSERMVRTCLTTRYPRDSYLLADKLSSGFFEKEEDIVPFFHLQLEECGVDWFDYYLMHAINAQSYEKYKACKAFETASRLKAEGRIGHVGMSFHDSAEVLDRILCEQSAIEFVQLQLNSTRNPSSSWSLPRAAACASSTRKPRSSSTVCQEPGATLHTRCASSWVWKASPWCSQA